MVKIDSGELPSAVGKEGYELTRVVHEWQEIAHGRFPDDCSKLLQMIDETDRLQLWKKNISGSRYKSRNDFLQKEVLINFDLTEANVRKIVQSLKNGDVESAQRVISAKDKIKELRSDKPDWTQQRIADEVGVSQVYVNKVITKSSHKEELVIPHEIEGNSSKADFRKLPPELQAKVAEKKVSLNAAAIQAGIRKKPTAEETIVKAFAKTEDKLSVAKLIVDSLDSKDRKAFSKWFKPTT